MSQTTAETQLVAELMTTHVLAVLLVNMGVQLTLQEKGLSMTKLRGLLAAALPDGPIPPSIPVVTPAAAKGYDATTATKLAAQKLEQTMTMISEQTAVALIRAGHKPTR